MLARSLLFQYFSMMINIIFPIVQMKIFLSVMNQSEWGSIAFALYLGGLCALIAELGFTFSSTRRFVNAGSSLEKSKIFSETFFAKLIVSFTVLIISSTAIFYYGENFKLFFAIILLSVIQSNSQIWIMQSIERNYIFLIPDSLVKFSVLIISAIYVKSISNVESIYYVFSLFAFSINFYNVVYLRKVQGIKLIYVPIIDTIRCIGQSIPSFIFKNMISVYMIGIPIMINAFLGPTSLGIYSIVDKITRALSSLSTPSINVLYPLFSTKRSVSRSALPYIKLSFLLICTVCIIVYSLSDMIFTFLGVYDYAIHKNLLLVMILNPALVLLNTMIVFLYIMPNNGENMLSLVFLVSAVFATILGIILIPSYGLLGAGVTMFLVEVLNFGLLFLGYTKVIRRKS